MTEVEPDSGPASVTSGTPPSFDPPAFSVDWRTSVDWVWVSSDRSVTDTTGAGFDSCIETDSNEIEYTLDETGESLYRSGQDRQQEHVGAIDVE